MDGRAVIVHYAEIGLKGGNRPQFERRLGDRLREGLRSAAIAATVWGTHGRILVTPEDPARAEAALEVATRIPGVARAALAAVTAAEIGAVERAAVGMLSRAPPGSFKVETQRADKSFPMTSLEVSRAAGAACVAASRRSVDVHAPDVTVNVEITRLGAYVSAAWVPGPGGLPVGSSGRLLAFVSGGLDSPVAAWMMLRRGAKVTAVHFHNRTHEGSAVLEKLEDLAATLAWAAGEMHLWVVPFEACQRAIVAAVPASHRMVVYRRAMFRIGGALAHEARALGFVTGDSLGQVASQTAENLRAIHDAATLPVYSPLIGMDKVDVVRTARRIGTYDTSIRPHEDCCSFLIAPSPVVRCRVDEVRALEAPLPWDLLVAEAAAGTVRSVHRPAPLA
jgi:thiamine biosynthesis protein ThiI